MYYSGQPIIVQVMCDKLKISVRIQICTEAMYCHSFSVLGGLDLLVPYRIFREGRMENVFRGGLSRLHQRNCSSPVSAS